MKRILLFVILIITGLSTKSPGAEMPTGGYSFYKPLKESTLDSSLNLLAERKRLTLINYTPQKEKVVTKKNLLIVDRCDSITLETIQSVRIDPKPQGLEKFWSKTDFVCDLRSPTKMGQDRFAWTVKETLFKRTSLGVSIISEYPVNEYAHPRLKNGSLFIGPHITFALGRGK